MPIAEDPWQARLDRMRQLLPLPLLLISAALALALPAAGSPQWARPDVGVPVTAAAAVWWGIVSVRLRGDASTRWRLVVFVVHTALAAVLVWVNSSYGIFAYTGFLFAYGLGRRWRIAGFAATALVVSAALAGGYPSGRPGHSLIYLLVAGVMLALVLNSARITNHAVQQNQERGQMIDELAEANRRLAASMEENAGLHAQLLVQAREAGILEERRRLAGEIHDTLAQGLAGIVAQLEAAEQARHRPGEWSRHLIQARSLARSSLTEARRSVRALRPEQLEDASLPEAIGVLARTWSEQSMVAVDVDTTGTPVRGSTRHRSRHVPGRPGGLSNVAKHARPPGPPHPHLSRRHPAARRRRQRRPASTPRPERTGTACSACEQRLAGVAAARSPSNPPPAAGTTINAAVPTPAGQFSPQAPGD